MMKPRIVSEELRCLNYLVRLLKIYLLMHVNVVHNMLRAYYGKAF